jgi:hypothetical protein
MHWAGQGRFEQAEVLISDALVLLDKRLAALDKDQPAEESLFSLFHPPADSVETVSKLTDLQRKLKQLLNLISTENRTNKPESAKRLARFVMLNPNNPGYPGELEELLSEMNKNDPLRDNVLLALVKLIPDEQLRAERLAELHKQCQNTDAGCQALYELALLKIHFWRQQNDSNIERKKQYLADAKVVLNNFLKLYPGSFSAEQVKKNLANLPASD